VIDVAQSRSRAIALEGARSATGSAFGAPEVKRWSSERRRCAVLRLPRGERVDAVSRDVPVTIAEPQINGFAERLNRTMKEQAIHGRIF
jgi:hypothetical protein